MLDEPTHRGWVTPLDVPTKQCEAPEFILDVNRLTTPRPTVRLQYARTHARISDANAEHELEERTAEAGRFVSEEAVLRLTLGKEFGRGDGDGGAGSGAGCGDDRDDGDDGDDGDVGGAGELGAATAPKREEREEGESGGVVPKLDEDYLRKVLEKVCVYRHLPSGGLVSNV